MSPTEMAVTLVTPRQKLVDAVATRVQLPSAEGQLTVLPQHAAYLGALGVGVVHITGPNGLQRYFVAEGFIEIDAARVVVLASRAMAVEDIDLVRAEQALVAAETRIKQLSGPEHPDYAAQLARRLRAQGRIAAARQS